MSDIAASLFQNPPAGPPEVRAARSPLARQAPDRRDDADGTSVEKTRKPEQAQPKEHATQTAVESSEPADTGSHGVADRNAAPPDRAPETVSDFQKVLQNRLEFSRARKNPKSDQTEDAAGEPKAPSWFTALADLLGANMPKMLAAKPAPASAQGQNAQSRSNTTAAQSPQNKPQMKTGLQAPDLPSEKASSEKTDGKNLHALKNNQAVGGQTSQPQPSADKSSAASDNNTKNSTAGDESAAQARQMRINLQAQTTAPVTAEEKTFAAHVTKTGEPAQSVKTGDPAQSVKTGKMASAEQSPKQASASQDLNKKDTKSAPARIDRMAAKDELPEEGAPPRANAAGPNASAKAAEATAEIAQLLKSPQQVESTDVADRPQATAAATQTVGKPGAFTAPTESPAEQIIQSIRLNARGPQQEIDIRLNPAELGAVRMRFQHANGEVTGALFVDKAQTRYEIEKELPQIIASLQQNGVQVRRIEVVLNQQNQPNEGHTPHGDAFAEADLGRFKNPGYEDGQPDADAGRGRPENNPTPNRTAAQLRQTHITDEAISVYV